MAKEIMSRTELDKLIKQLEVEWCLKDNESQKRTLLYDDVVDLSPLDDVIKPAATVAVGGNADVIRLPTAVNKCPWLSV